MYIHANSCTYNGCVQYMCVIGLLHCTISKCRCHQSNTFSNSQIWRIHFKRLSQRYPTVQIEIAYMRNTPADAASRLEHAVHVMTCMYMYMHMYM